MNVSMISSLFLLLQIPSAEVHIGVPPAALYGSEKGMPEVVFGNIHGFATYSTVDKSFDIEWVQIDPVSGEGDLTLDQTFSLSYWPTDILAGGQNEIIVAGKRPRGATCIEVFTLGSPTVLFPIGDDPFLAPAPIDSIDELYSESTVSRDMVTHMFRQQGANADGLFVQFWDSKDVYLISRLTGSYNLIASPSPQASPVLSEPKLGEVWADAITANHKTLGFLYGFCNSDFEDGLGAVYLVDDDASRDGVIDYVLYMTPQDWADMEMGLASSYDPLPD